MLFSSLLDRFIKESPIAVMAQATIAYTLNAASLDALFKEHASAQYEHRITFSALADLMSLAVCQIYRSVNSAYAQRKEQIAASLVAAYGKLSRMELPILTAFVSETAERLGAVVRQLQAHLPSPIPGYRAKVVDGNHLAATERRLKVLRRQAAAPLPGQALVVYDPQLDRMTHTLPCEGGHAQERPLLAEVLSLVGEGEVWIEGRNSCTTDFLFGIRDRKAHLLVRQHAGSVPWEALSEPSPCGRCATGAVYEQSVRLEAEDGRGMVCRRITLKLDKPARDGDTELHILTNLPQAVSALVIAGAYRERWTIEVGFLQLATALESEIDTLAYPKAALFGFAVGVAAYNVLSVVQAALRSEHGGSRVQQEVSTFYIAEELSAVSAGLKIAVPWTTWSRIAALAVTDFADWLREVARQADLTRYQKHPRGPKKKQAKPRYDKKKPHVATYRELKNRNVTDK